MTLLLKPRTAYILLALVVATVIFTATRSSNKKSPHGSELVLIQGGEFQMGDLFDEGSKNEKPVHKVVLSDFYLSKHETTVAQFKAFVAETGYVTRAERLDSREEQQARYTKLVEKAKARQQDEEFVALYKDFLDSGGCFYWISDPGSFDFSVDCNWKIPLIEQTDDDPVVCMAWVDAASYCNWLSEKDGLPPAYDVDTGELIDMHGKPTLDISEVKGYRLPTEAEWEFAARQGGEKIRFGNGRDVATAREMNFNAAAGDYDYSAAGSYRDRTSPVGSFDPNGLGIYDMSGNAWEWCSDYYCAYEEADQTDPHCSKGMHRVLRGGRWGGSAVEARASARAPYEPINRCNNAGFRIARTLYFD
jgi:formylglycine-generating enzyme required for sulfatase activity